MATSKKDHAQSKSISKQSDPDQEKTVNVLYQKLAGKWYSFTVIDEDVFLGQLPEEAISEIRKNEMKR